MATASHAIPTINATATTREMPVLRNRKITLITMSP
jgi:hypothetical protein